MNSIQIHGRNPRTYKALVALAGVVLLMTTGCATSGRRVLLKEYGPTVPVSDASPLKGVTVAIGNFTEAFNIDDKLSDKQPVEPPGYEYQKMSKADEDTWNQDVKKRKKGGSEKSWKEIGYVRNGFGMVMSKVYALNPSGEWLGETLRRDVAAKGATVVGSPTDGAPQVSVSGSIKFFKIDIYMKYWADLIVDVTITVPGKPPIERTIHTTAGQTAWSSSSFEYYQSIRQCQQKLSRALIAEIEGALRN
ncbi:MAG: hypothetical protein IT581_21395 [Verrucomicrobiales bacterium]|nr:hypothetical protein [Verrucomicrobiales bacterium]